jgi:hypothetical protein
MLTLRTTRAVLERCDPQQDHFDQFSEAFIIRKSGSYTLEIPLSNRPDISGAHTPHQ